MSNEGPNIPEAIAEHSICQPGLPKPQGDSHEGSPGLLFFQSAKSFKDFFSPLCSAVVKSPRNKILILHTRLEKKNLPSPSCKLLVSP